MRLNDIKDNPGSAKKRVRVGRGIGSGCGKTGGRGVKGQKSRTGVAIGGFEGGQMPLYRRLPKRGFNKWRRKSYNEVSLARLQQAIEAGKLDAAQEVDASALVASGVIRRPLDGVRILGVGEIKTALNLNVDHASSSAKAAIEKAGGSVTLIEKKVLEDDEAKRAKTAAKKAGSEKSK